MINLVEPSNPFIEFNKEDIEQSIPARFEQQVRQYPSRLAIKFKGQTFTYEALNQLANRIARAILAHRGPGEEPVGLIFEPSAMGVAAIIGTLKAGKIWVPLDPSFPPARLTHILADAQITLLVTDNQNYPLLNDLNISMPVINVDRLAGDLPSDNLNLPLSADTLAYILYTSGSTGHPKGVIQNHRNVLHAIRLHTNSLHICADDRLSMLASYSHLAGATAILRALLNGAALFPHYLKKEGVASLADWLRQEEITLIQTVSTVFRHLVETLTGEETFPKLRLIHLGGEPVSRRDVEHYKKYFGPHCLLLNHLGSTEVSSYRQYFINKSSQIGTNIVPVGYAVEDKEVLLLDQAGQPSGFDQIGEIVVKSRYLALGYWGKPDLTQAQFSPVPDEEGVRLFRTGDLGCLQPDGRLIYMGRKDSQVKIRGQRVEIAEVELALTEHPDVREAAVVVRENHFNDKYIVGYLVSRQTQQPSSVELRHFLKNRLPEYMIPATFVYLEALPLAASGKINRSALPDPDFSQPASTHQVVAARDTLELQLTKIWENLLNVQPVGVTDNFFDLGGYSSLAIQMFTQIKKITGKSLPLATLFQAPTIAQLVEVIRREGEPEPISSLVALQPMGSNRPFFCLPGNLGNVFTDLSYLVRYLDPNQPFYALQDGIHTPVHIVDQAAYYLKEIRRVQPEGPYLLGGICLGGFVAYEMAQQLLGQGQEVALLALIEPPPPRTPTVKTYIQFAVKTVRRFFRRARHHTHLLAHGEAAEQGTYLRLKVKVVANSWALASYRLRPYPGQLHLFLSTDSLKKIDNPQLNWLKLATGGSELHETVGSHDTITGNNDTKIEEAHIQVLAENLNNYFKQLSLN